ncbi:MAG: type II secretion system F family protein [Bacilli bacterium]|nr:type II secretion system F family protein [Bacilli bacterium]
MGQKNAALEVEKQNKTEKTNTVNVTNNTSSPTAEKAKAAEVSKNVTTKKSSNPLFKVFDVFFSFILSIFSYIFLVFKAIYKILFRRPFIEIYELCKAFYKGTAFSLEWIFIGIPTHLYRRFSKPVVSAYYKTKDSIDKIKKKGAAEQESGKTFTQTVREYINKKYNEIPSVKAAQAKKEASLRVMSIDPNSDDVIKTDEKRTYKYIARNKDGVLEEGYFAAQSKLDVYSYLIDKGMTVYEITTSWAINFFHTESSSIKRRMKNKDLIFWLAQISTYVRSGIPLTDAVKVLAKQDKRRKYKGVYDSIIYELTMGEPFSEALRKQGNSFPALLVNMIKSAEMIGNIEDTLDEMSDYYQEIEDTKKAIISALTYPSIVLIFAIGIVVFMLVYIVPQFVGVYESMQAELNPVTQITLNISAYLKTKYMNIIGFIVGVVSVYILAYKKIKLFRTLNQTLFMKLPVVGNLIVSKEMALFARTFATLNKNNVLLTDSIDILAKITGNEIYKAIMLKTINNLLKGEKMSVSFKDHWAVPEVAYYMILTGESTGELAEMLDKVGDYYHKLERNSVNQIKTFIEPIMIVFLAVIVGFILVAIVVPMFGIYQTIQ